MPNVGINGFCRIGRIVLRTCLERPEIQVTAINDPAVDIEYMCYLIKFDSTHGKFLDDEVVPKRQSSEIIIRGKTIKIFHEKTPTKIPWQLANVQYVVEASGIFTTLEKASGHLTNGVQQVIVTAPSANIPMLILGVNDQKVNLDHKVISTTSSTLYCLAPIVKILEDNYGVSEGFLTSIHAMTPSLKPLDGLSLRGKYWRDHRSIHQNIIPASTGACKALGKIIPTVKDKLAGTAFRVPIVNVSILDLTIRLNTPTSIADILQTIEQQSLTKMKNVIRISYEEAVSSDFMTETHSCVVDANSSIQLRPNFFKLICWYENEYSYACRVTDSILFTEKMANPGIELYNKVSATVVNKIAEDESKCSQRQKTSSIVKDESGDPSQESNGKNMMRIPKRVSDNDCLEFTVTKDTVVTDTLPIQYDSANLNNFDQRDFDTEQLSQGTFLIAKKLNEHVKEKNKRTSIPSQKTFLKTISTVKIFQAQQERLEKVKKEFEKVASFTEDLLNKTKTFNGKLVSLSNKSINDLNQRVEKPPDEATFDLTYAKYDSKSDSKIIRSSECSEEVKNWNFEEYRECSHSGKSEENQNAEDIILKSVDTVVKAETKEEDKVLELSKDEKNGEYKLVNEIKSEETENGNRSRHIDKVPYGEVCQNKSDSKCPTVRGQYFETTNNVKYDEYQESLKITDNENNISNIASASKISGITTGTLQSKMEMTKDLSDLYDKLDSMSNTGSEGSFHEKKSQILKFSDLSHSMDELEKIDQFCRIIEISDEISDHLFAALTKRGPESNKEWTFGELCKKINLDDFCKKMFKKL